MATASRKTGFDCEFVEQPQKQFQSECPVCLQILREPYQATCCGNSFCRVCIERIKTDNKPCPTCTEKNFVMFPDKRLQRSLYEFQVYCSHKQEGCEWKGELGQLDKHLNLSPQPDKQLEGCEYSEIECIYCSELIKRFNIAVHQNDNCPKRPFSCEYCQTYKTNYEDVINNHWPVCGYHPVRCQNECGAFPQRQGLENHVTRDCPNTVIDCDFHHVGCDVKLPRKDMPAHLKEKLVTHMSLQAASYSKLLASYNVLQASHNEVLANQKHLEERVRTLESENKSLQNTAKTLESIVGYREFTMENYEHCFERCSNWYSPPFYAHTGGYKLCLRVYPNRYAKDLWVYVHLMKGEFDDYLQWPFCGRITIQLVDQEGTEKHYTNKIEFSDQSGECSHRVTKGERNATGLRALFPYSKLQPTYLKNDCLHFRVLPL